MKMKKIFFILALTLLFVTEGFGQAVVDIPIIVHDNNGEQQILWFGLDLTATNSIDPWLGEAEIILPPVSPFDARWWLPPFNGVLSSWKDYRAPGNPPAFPFTGTIQYSVKFQTDSSWWPITISWNLPPEISPTSTIQDIWGGGIINKIFAGNDSLVIDGPTGIYQLYIFVDYDNIIPVELTSFTAEVFQNSVELNWTTATETNNSGFEILRKVYPTNSGTQYDNEWEAIGFVPGFGTTTEPKSYSFTDDDITTRTYKYRLKQIDFDGTFTFSNEIEVEVDFTPKEFVLYQNYPNPFNPNTTIKYQIPASLNPSKGGTLRKVTLKVYDLLGNQVAVLVNQEQESGVYKFEFDAYSLSSGTYFYQIKSGDFVDTKKMILLR